jgi:hypothetical protein
MWQESFIAIRYSYDPDVLALPPHILFALLQAQFIFGSLVERGSIPIKRMSPF